MGSRILRARNGRVAGLLILWVAGCNGASPPSPDATASPASTVAPVGSVATTTKTTNQSVGPVQTTSLGTGRVGHTATLMPSGNVFVAGGVDASGAAID